MPDDHVLDVSVKAAEIHALLRTAILADDSVLIPENLFGEPAAVSIGLTIELAERLMRELREEINKLEAAQRKAA